MGALMNTETESLKILWNTEESIDGIFSFGDPVVDQAILEEIAEKKREFGNKLVILGHHYERDEILQFADHIEDSLALSRYASTLTDVQYVIFLGIHIMAETADMLTPVNVPVLLPDLRAGCTLGDMAPVKQIEKCWEDLVHLLGEGTVLPISYINAGADVKGFVGKKGGPCCTSSNPATILSWGFDRYEKILFLPDYNLGFNAAYSMGISAAETIKWRRGLPLGGNTEEALRKAKLILWDGHCSVHGRFTTDHVQEWKRRDPSMNVIVHPEVNHDVFQLADAWGSTTDIIQTIRSAAPGTSWAVGTEHNMVDRLARAMDREGKDVVGLAPEHACMCAPMFRITAETLLETLTALQQGEYKWPVTVDEDTRRFAGESLQKMFKIAG